MGRPKANSIHANGLTDRQEMILEFIRSYISENNYPPSVREIADITISARDLHQLIVLKELSNLLMKRVNFNYDFVVSFNAALIALGVAGILPPATTALLHNGSTIALSLHSMTNLKKFV